MRKHRQIILCGIAIATAAAVGIYIYRELVIEIIGRILAGIMMIPLLWVLKEAWEALIASWPIRKLWEGVYQIARALDRIPGAVYVIVLALGICDSFQWLPYGIRDIEDLLPDRQRRVETSADSEQPSSHFNKKSDLPSAPQPTFTPAPPPSEVRLAAPAPVPEISPLPTTPRAASAKERDMQRVAPSSVPKVRQPAPHVDVENERPAPLPAAAPRKPTSRASKLNSDARSSETHVLEFHVPEHGNDPLHVTVHDSVQLGDVVATTLHGRAILLRIRRPLTDSPRDGSVPRWLAVPVDQGSATVVATP